MPQNIFKIDRSNVETLDLKMLLLIGGIVIVFFLFIYPMLTKKEFFSLDGLKQKAKNAYGVAKEKFSVIQKMTDNTLDAGCAKPEETKVETMSDVQQATKIDAFGSLDTPKGNADIDAHKVDTQMCSKACCSPQWGQENATDDRIMPNDLGTKYFSTNYMCNGENPGDKGHGCVCVTNDTFGYLGERGGNNME